MMENVLLCIDVQKIDTVDAYRLVAKNQIG